jgi:hypothetical protein
MHHFAPSLFIFLHRQNSDLANLQVSDLEWTVHGALQFHYRMTEFVEQTTYDSVSSLSNSNFEPRSVLVILYDRRRSLNEAVRESHSLLKFLQQSLLNASFHSSLIHALKPEAGVHETLRNLAIVGQNHETSGIPVQTPDREIRLVVLGEEIRHRAPTFRIAQGRDHPAWFIQKNNPLGRRVNWSAINLDLINRWVDLSSEFGAYLAINLHSSFDDELLHFSARSNTTLREKLL